MNDQEQRVSGLWIRKLVKESWERGHLARFSLLVRALRPRAGKMPALPGFVCTISGFADENGKLSSTSFSGRIVQRGRKRCSSGGLWGQKTKNGKNGSIKPDKSFRIINMTQKTNLEQT